LAVQGQDPRGFRLAVRARTTGLTAADVDSALTEERSLLVTWLNRGTLHLVRSEDYPWLQALTPPRLFTTAATRLAQEGVSPDAADRAIAVVERSLAKDGIRTEGQALVQILFLASLRGLIVRGPMAGRDHAFVLVRDWLGPHSSVDLDTALAELARRYLAGHGPAGDRDLARWAGLPLRDARAALNAIASEIEVGADGLVDLARRPPAEELPPPKLLGQFDPLLLGWASRTPILGAEEKVVVGNGMFRAFALVRGRGAAVWKLSGGKVALEPFGRITRKDATALDEDAADVVRFLTPR
jgi:winged helix DNA-binding protein